MVVQVCLGGTIVWTQRAVIPTTVHVLTGASILATSLVLTLRTFKHVVRPAGARVLGSMPAEGLAS